jgi:hypothetical protein
MFPVIKVVEFRSLLLSEKDNDRGWPQRFPGAREYYGKTRRFIAVAL